LQWDVALNRAWIHTLLVSAAASVLASLLGSLLAVSIAVLRVHGSRWCTAALFSMALIPVYVQATAWSAGFGTQGWLRLSQVDAAKFPWWGIASVVWIHAVASAPICFLIIGIGLRRILDSAYQQALVEGGIWFAWKHVIARRIAPWIGAAMLWTFCMTQNDMVVTNLFQVPTLCESVYQQVQFGKLRSAPIAVSIALAAACGGLIGGLAYRMVQRRRIVEGVPGYVTQSIIEPVPFLQRSALAIWSMVAWALVSVIAIVPLMNLLFRAGWKSSMVDGHPLREWSVVEALHSLGQCNAFVPELTWSLQLASWSAALALLLALLLNALVPANHGLSMVVLGVLGTMLALPGPLVALSVLRGMTNALPEDWGFLMDQTLIAPIVALQFRCLPIAYGILWLARWDYRERMGSTLQLEKSLPASTRYRVELQYVRGSIWTALWLAFLIAFGDLASYLLLQPPGVTTVAMRLFDLLHYGIRNREASLALVLALGSAVPSAWIAVRVQRALTESSHR
jgi:ABC-type Fe3+ transport system permease subunit